MYTWVSAGAAELTAEVGALNPNLCIGWPIDNPAYIDLGSILFDMRYIFWFVNPLPPSPPPIRVWTKISIVPFIISLNINIFFFKWFVRVACDYSSFKGAFKSSNKGGIYQCINAPEIKPNEKKILVQLVLTFYDNFKCLRTN